MVRNESLYMSFYLCIIVTIGLSGTVTEIDMQNFCSHGYIFERRFSPTSFKTYHFHDLDR